MSDIGEDGVHYGNDKCWVCGKPNINGLGGMRLCEEHKAMDPANPWKESQDKIANLKAEVERLRAEVETAGLAYRNLFANMQKLEAENAELRETLAEVQQCADIEAQIALTGGSKS